MTYHLILAERTICIVLSIMLVKYKRKLAWGHVAQELTGSLYHVIIGASQEKFRARLELLYGDAASAILETNLHQVPGHRHLLRLFPKIHIRSDLRYSMLTSLR